MESLFWDENRFGLSEDVDAVVKRGLEGCPPMMPFDVLAKILLDPGGLFVKRELPVLGLLAAKGFTPPIPPVPPPPIPDPIVLLPSLKLEVGLKEKSPAFLVKNADSCFAN